MRGGTRKRARPKIADKDNTKDLTYLTAFVTRKFLMLEFVSEEKLRAMPWDTVTIPMLQTISPVQIKALDGPLFLVEGFGGVTFPFWPNGLGAFRKLLSLPCTMR